MPEIPGYDISAVMIPAMEVGGDFYDIIPTAEGKCVFVIADVSGQGRKRGTLHGDVPDASPGRS